MLVRGLYIAAILALIPAPASADSGNNEVRTGTATAQAVRPLILTHASGYVISFGKFAVGSSGTVTVSALGAGTASGGVTFALGSSTSADRFIAQGDPNRLISITTSSGTVTAGSNSMSFTTTPSLPAGYIPLTGSGYFTVGGTLSVGAGQGAGSYSGSYAVTVAYN